MPNEFEFEAVPVGADNKEIPSQAFEAVPVDASNKPTAPQGVDFEAVPVDAANQPLVTGHPRGIDVDVTPSVDGMYPLAGPFDTLLGAGAAAVDIASGGVKALAGGLNEIIHLPGNILKGTPEKIGEPFRETMEAFPIPWDKVLPEGARKVQEGLELPFAVPGVVGEVAGEKVLETTGSPEAAAGVATLVEAIPFLALAKQATDIISRESAFRVVGKEPGAPGSAGPEVKALPPTEEGGPVIDVTPEPPPPRGPSPETVRRFEREVAEGKIYKTKKRADTKAGAYQSEGIEAQVVQEADGWKIAPPEAKALSEAEAGAPGTERAPGGPATPPETTKGAAGGPPVREGWEIVGETKDSSFARSQVDAAISLGYSAEITTLPDGTLRVLKSLERGPSIADLKEKRTGKPPEVPSSETPIRKAEPPVPPEVARRTTVPEPASPPASPEAAPPSPIDYQGQAESLGVRFVGLQDTGIPGRAKVPMFQEEGGVGSFVMQPGETTVAQALERARKRYAEKKPKEAGVTGSPEQLVDRVTPPPRQSVYPEEQVPDLPTVNSDLAAVREDVRRITFEIAEAERTGDKAELRFLREKRDRNLASIRKLEARKDELILKPPVPPEIAKEAGRDKEGAGRIPGVEQGREEAPGREGAVQDQERGGRPAGGGRAVQEPEKGRTAAADASRPDDAGVAGHDDGAPVPAQFRKGTAEPVEAPGDRAEVRPEEVGGISDPVKRDRLLKSIGLKVGDEIEFRWTQFQKDWGKTTVVGVSNTKDGPVPITRPKARHADAPSDVLWDRENWRIPGVQEEVTAPAAGSAIDVTQGEDLFSVEAPDGQMTVIPTTDPDAPGTYDIIQKGKNSEVYLVDTADTLTEAIATARRHAEEEVTASQGPARGPVTPEKTGPASNEDMLRHSLMRADLSDLQREGATDRQILDFLSEYWHSEGGSSGRGPIGNYQYYYKGGRENPSFRVGSFIKGQGEDFKGRNLAKLARETYGIPMPEKVTAAPAADASRVTPPEPEAIVPPEIVRKSPEEVTHPFPTPPYSDRWYADRGAIPGEPSHFLDGNTAEDAKGVLVERVSEQGTSSWDGYLADGLPVVHGETFEKAAEIMEKRVDRDTMEAGGEHGRLETADSGEPGGLPSGSPGAVEEQGGTGDVPERADGLRAGERDILQGEESEPERKPGRRTRPQRRAPAGEGVGEEALEEIQSAVAAADEKFSVSPGKHDYAITNPEEIASRGKITRARDNIAAIKILRALQEEGGRLATPEEQKTLARYTGWGGLSEAFRKTYSDKNKSWDEIYDELYRILPQDLWKEARDTILNAHYTSLDVVDAMWDAVKTAGFKGGRVLEPGAGIGYFLMRVPPELRAKTRFTAIEIDSVTGEILKQLNQNQDVKVLPFEKAALSDNFYDLAISNVPFSEVSILADKAYTKYRFSLHDFFFAKALDKVRPGGIVAFITSRYTMDKVETKVREYLSGKADFLGAVRLPNTAFKGNAQTEVVTDILFLKRRAEGEPALGEEWKDVKPFTRGEASANVNVYYGNRPQNIIGNEAFTGSMYRQDEYTVNPANEDLGEAIRKSTAAFLPGTYEKRSTSGIARKRLEIEAPEGLEVKDNGYVVKPMGHGKLTKMVYQRVGDKLVAVTGEEKKVRHFEALIGVRDAARNLILHQQEPDFYGEGEFETALKSLNDRYDEAVAKYGYLSAPENARLFSADPEYQLLRAVERYNSETKKAEKADLLKKRIIDPVRKKDRAETPQDAVLISIREEGGVDLERIGALLSTTPEAAREALRGIIYQTPEGEWQTREQYLSGNVRKKLWEAEAAANVDHRFKENVEALSAVIPADLPPSQIYAPLGAPWIKPEYIVQFVADLVGEQVKVHYLAATGTWTVEIVYRGYQARDNVAALTSTWGTNRANAIQLIAESLNMQIVTIRDRVEDDKTVVNMPETLAAREKQNAIKDRFREWVWEDAERAADLARFYNDNFNAFVEPKHDGVSVYMTPEGRPQVPGQNKELTLRDTQINAFYRALVQGNTLFWHEVGTGKTWIMAALAMELRRLGYAQKPCIVVPKVIFRQIQSDFMRLFPGAKILAPTKQDFDPANRQRFLFRVATGDWDAIVLTKEHFQKIPTPVDTEADLISEQLDELERAISEMQEEEGGRKKGRSQSRAMKDMIRARNRLQQKLEKYANIKRDEGVLMFDQTGIDYVMVDEAHYFKNLAYITRMNRIAGLGNPSGNDRSWDLYVKSTYLNRLTKNRGVVLSTGTPISNSIAETFTVMRYLMPDTLKELSLSAFDSWAATFGRVVSGWEVGVDGTYKAKARFSQFENLDELSKIFRQVTDAVTAELAGVTRPEVERVTVAAEGSQEYFDYVATLAARAERLRTGQVDPHDDNFPNIATDGRHAAVDIRLRVPGLPDNPDSKINKAVDSIYQEWVAGKDEKTTQLVFLDLGVEKDVGTYSTYADMRKKLVDRGIPPAEIVAIQEKKYDKDDVRHDLYRKVREGKVRILFGSTLKMGEGMNVQDRAIALHHIDPTYTPAGIMQREGRIVRQGNRNKKVRIYTYLTTGARGLASFDTFMWQLQELKARPINDLQSNATPGRTSGDVGGVVLSAAEWKAISSGDPLMMEKVRVEDEFSRLNMLRSQHGKRQVDLRYQVQEQLSSAGRIEQAILPKMERDLAVLEKNADANVVTAGGKKYDVSGGEGTQERMAEFAKGLFAVGKSLEKRGFDVEAKIGEYRGFEIRGKKSRVVTSKGTVTAYLFRLATETLQIGWQPFAEKEEHGAGTIFKNHLARAIGEISETRLAKFKADAEKHRKSARDLEKDLGKPFKDAERLETLRTRLSEINTALGMGSEQEDLANQAAVEANVGNLEERTQEKEEPEGDGGGDSTLYSNPFDPELIRKAYRGLETEIRDLRERQRLAKGAKKPDLETINATINTPYYIFTELFPEGAPVFDRARRMMQERDDIASELAETGLPYFTGLELKEKDAVNKVFIKGRFERTVYEREELEKKLSSDQVTAYFAVRRMLDRALEHYEDAIIYRLTKGKVPASSSVALDLLADVLDQLGYPEDHAEILLKEIAKIRDARRKGYAPFTRFGDVAYGLLHVDPETGKPDWKNPYYWEKAESPWAAAGKYQALTKRFKKGIGEGRLYPVPPRELGEKAEKEILSNVGIFEVEILAKIAGIDPSLKQEFGEAISRMVRGQGFPKHFFESKDTPGFTTDMERALAEYIVSISGFIARLKGVPEMDSLAQPLAKKPKLAQYYRTWRDYLVSPQEEFHRFRSFLFLYFLGGVVKSAAVNLTQPLTATLPWLTQYVSEARAMAEIGRATKDVLAAMGKKPEGGYGVIVDRLPKDVRETVRRGYMEGIISEQIIFELMGVARKPSRLRKLSKQKQRLVRGFGFLFSMAEKANRLVTMIAAQRVHQSLLQIRAGGGGGKPPVEPPKPPRGSAFEDDPFEFSKRAVDESQFIYAKYNRPRMFRGWGAALGVFRTFILNYLELLARLMRRRPRAVLSAMAMLWFFAGVKGLPFAENTKDLLEEVWSVFSHKKPDLETAAREWGYDHMGSALYLDFLINGPQRHITGIDIGRSVGAGDIIPIFDKWQDLPSGIIGAPAEVLVKRPLRAHQRLMEGDVSRAVEAVAPEFLRGPMVAGRFLKEGALDVAGKPMAKKEDLSAWDVAVKAAGFQPTAISKANEREAAKQALSERTGHLRRDIMRQVVNLTREGKGKEAEEIIQTRVHGIRPKRNREAVVFTRLGLTDLPKDPADWIILDEQAIEKDRAEAALGPEMRGVLKHPTAQIPAFLKINKLYK